MAEQTVKQLAESVGTPVDRLLGQMKDAGLPHTAETDAVTEDQKQHYLKELAMGEYIGAFHRDADGYRVIATAQVVFRS